MDNKFMVGGIEFEAVRCSFPIKHWRLKTPDGKIWPTGLGVSSESRPKIKADLEYILERFGNEGFTQMWLGDSSTAQA